MKKPHIIISAVAVVIGVVILLLVASLMTKPKSANPQSPQSTQHALPKFKVSDGIQVLMDALPLAKACESDNQYFVLFDAESENEDWHGWYHLKDYEFKQLKNGTWYTDRILASNLQGVANINTTGLECQEKK